MAPAFLDVETVVKLHERVMRLTPGEPTGVHSPAALESAVMAPRNLYCYGETDLHQLAARYAFHLAMDHAFFAGNKRTAAAACVAFLAVNGCSCRFSGRSFGRQIERLIKGRTDTDGLARYLRERSSLPAQG